MKMIVSRRSYLLSKPSQHAMRAAGAASAKAAREQFSGSLQERHADMLRRAGVSEAEIAAQSGPIAA